MRANKSSSKGKKVEQTGTSMGWHRWAITTRRLFNLRGVFMLRKSLFAGLCSGLLVSLLPSAAVGQGSGDAGAQPQRQERQVPTRTEPRRSEALLPGARDSTGRPLDARAPRVDQTEPGGGGSPTPAPAPAPTPTPMAEICTRNVEVEVFNGNSANPGPSFGGKATLNLDLRQTNSFVWVLGEFTEACADFSGNGTGPRRMDFLLYSECPDNDRVAGGYSLSKTDQGAVLFPYGAASVEDFAFRGKEGRRPRTIARTVDGGTLGANCSTKACPTTDVTWKGRATDRNDFGGTGEDNTCRDTLNPGIHNTRRSASYALNGPQFSTTGTATFVCSNGTWQVDPATNRCSVEQSCGQNGIPCN